MPAAPKPMMFRTRTNAACIKKRGKRRIHGPKNTRREMNNNQYGCCFTVQWSWWSEQWFLKGFRHLLNLRGSLAAWATFTRKSRDLRYSPATKEPAAMHYKPLSMGDTIVSIGQDSPKFENASANHGPFRCHECRGWNNSAIWTGLTQLWKHFSKPWAFQIPWVSPLDDNSTGRTQLLKYAFKPPNNRVDELVTTGIISFSLSLYAGSGSKVIFRQ